MACIKTIFDLWSLVFISFNYDRKISSMEIDSESQHNTNYSIVFIFKSISPNTKNFSLLLGGYIKLCKYEGWIYYTKNGVQTFFTLGGSNCPYSLLHSSVPEYRKNLYKVYIKVRHRGGRAQQASMASRMPQNGKREPVVVKDNDGGSMVMGCDGHSRNRDCSLITMAFQSNSELVRWQ